MARTGARSVCRSVASVPFFGGGGLLGRSWGMRQSRPGCCARICCGARRAWLAVAPSNAMRAACGELAVALLIVAMKTYRKHVLGRAMIPRLWRMGGPQRLHSKSGCLQTLRPSRFAGVLRPSPGVSARVFSDASASKVSRGYAKSSGQSEEPRIYARSVPRSIVQTTGNESLCHLPIARFAACSEKE